MNKPTAEQWNTCCKELARACELIAAARGSVDPKAVKVFCSALKSAERALEHAHGMRARAEYEHNRQTLRAAAARLEGLNG